MLLLVTVRVKSKQNVFWVLFVVVFAYQPSWDKTISVGVVLYVSIALLETHCLIFTSHQANFP